INYPLGGKFNSGGAEVETAREGASKAAHAAVDISYARAKEKIEKPRKHRRADVPMMPGHGSALDFSAQAIADYELVSFAPFGNKARDFCKVMAAIGVAHDVELAASFFTAFA